MTFDNLRNLRIIFFEKRKITLKMFEDNFENRFRSHFNHKIDSRMWNNGNGRNVAGNICEIRKVRRNNWRENSRKKKKGGRENGLSETVSIFQYRERQISPVDFFLSRIIPVSNAYSLSSYRFDATSCFVHPVDPIVSDRIIKKKKKMKENQGKRRKKIEK